MATTTTLSRDDKSSLLAREAKQHRSALKALLDKPNAQPGSTAIDFARKEVRNAYLKLLFACTFSSRAHGADTALWLETTHPLVHKYRSRLSVYEKEFSKVKAAADQAATAGVAASTAATARTSKQQQGQQTQAYLKLSAAFRDFLSAEETFWRDLAGRVVRVFRLDEAKANLRVLGIACDDNDASLSFSSDTSTGMERIPGADGADEALLQAAQLPANRRRLVEVVHKALICCGDLARYRELYRDDRAVEPAAGSAAAAGKRGGARPRGGKAIAAAVAARTSKEVSLRRDFSKAAACYEQARLLLPHNGNPSNQLAVIATYYRDAFLATYHYYRALCVKVPFDTAKQNLEITLRKAVDAWVAQGGPERVRTGAALEGAAAAAAGNGEESAAQSEERAAKTLSSFVTLHGLFYTRQHFTLIQPCSEEFLRSLQASLSERALLADAVVRIVVTGLAASWTTRLWRNGPSAPSAVASRSRRGRSSNDEASAAASPSMAATQSAEHQILAHVLGVFRTLVEVGTSETREALETNRKHPPTAPARMRGAADVSANAARNITAAFRRTLPALRISSKWMKSHLEYISRSADRAAALSQESQDSSQPSGGPQELSQRAQEEAEARVKAESALVVETAALWRSYVDFVNILRFAFPFDALPSLGTMGESGAIALALEEDADMRGFAPTSKAMLYVNGASPEAPAQPSTSQVHPNEEQLMRIADLLIDAKVMAESDASPIAFDDERNVFVFDEGGPGVGVAQRNTAPVIPLAPTALASDQYVARGHVEEGSENTSEATEDVVDLAMRAGAGGLKDDDDEEDDEDEQILIPSSSAHGVAQTLRRQQEQQLYEHQQQGASSADAFASPGTPSMSRRAAPATSPTAPDIEPGSLTAQHLLLQVLSGRSPAPASPPTNVRAAPPHVASVPQPQLLFGGVAEMSIAATASIWAPGPGEAGRPFSPSRAAWDSVGSGAGAGGARQAQMAGSPHGHIGAPYGGTANMQTQSTMASSMGNSLPFGSTQSFPPPPDAFAQQQQQQQHMLQQQQQQQHSYGSQPARDTSALQRQQLQQPYFGG